MAITIRLAREGMLSRAGRAFARAGRAVRWYATNLMGETAYATYVEHHRRTHPDSEPMSERAFWRRHYADQDANPGSRCC